MLRRRFLALLPGLAAAVAIAAEQPFEFPPFEAARQSGDPVLVVVYADWCPTCRRQDKVLGELLRRPEYTPIRTFRVDFDMQDDALKALRVTRQSTLILYRGGREIARSTGETRPAALEQFLAKAVAG